MKAVWLVVVLLYLCFTLFIPTPTDKAVFLDIGQGDAILLQHGTQQVLIDGGPGTQVLQRLGEELPWFDRKIDVVISTHPDKDHLGGLLHVLERYEVGLVLLPEVAHTTELQAEWLKRLTQAVEMHHVAYRFGWEGEKLQLGDLKLAVLGPPLTPDQSMLQNTSTNNAAVITRVDFGQLSLLLSADADASVERQLVGSYPTALDVDILKAGHHGSKNSTSAELVAATTPSLVVISVGAKNTYGHPHPDTLKRLGPIPVARTDEVGSVRLTRQGQEWLLSCGATSLFPKAAKSCMKTSSS